MPAGGNKKVKVLPVPMVHRAVPISDSTAGGTARKNWEAWI